MIDNLAEAMAALNLVEELNCELALLHRRAIYEKGH